MKNQTNLLFLLLFLNAIWTQAQTLQRDSIAGIWICMDATIPPSIKVPQKELEPLNILKSAIVNSKLLFKKNGLFEWQFPEDVNPAVKEMSFLNGQPWSIDAQKNLIHVGIPKDNLMQVLVLKKDNVIYFMLSDTPLLLRMQKQ